MKSWNINLKKNPHAGFAWCWWEVKSVSFFNEKRYYFRVSLIFIHTKERFDQSSLHSSINHPEQTCLGRDLNAGTARQAGTVPKRNLDRYSEPLQYHKKYHISLYTFMAQYNFFLYYTWKVKKIIFPNFFWTVYTVHCASGALLNVR